MPYEISWSDRGVHIRYYGALHIREIYQSHNEVYGDDRFQGVAYMVLDSLRVEKVKNFDIDRILEQIRIVAKLDRSAATTKPGLKVFNLGIGDTADAVYAYHESEMSGTSWTFEISSSADIVDSWLEQMQASGAITN